MLVLKYIAIDLIIAREIGKRTEKRPFTSK